MKKRKISTLSVVISFVAALTLLFWTSGISGGQGSAVSAAGERYVPLGMAFPSSFPKKAAAIGEAPGPLSPQETAVVGEAPGPWSPETAIPPGTDVIPTALPEKTEKPQATDKPNATPPGTDVIPTALPEETEEPQVVDKPDGTPQPTIAPQS